MGFGPAAFSPACGIEPYERSGKGSAYLGGEVTSLSLAYAQSRLARRLRSEAPFQAGTIETENDRTSRPRKAGLDLPETSDAAPEDDASPALRA